MRTLKISLLVFILSITISAQNFWYQTNGPYGGYFTSIVSIGLDTVLVSDSFKGFHRSTNNGLSWEYVPFSIGHYLTLSDMLVNDNKMIVASSIYSNDVYTSFNGINWEIKLNVFQWGGPIDLCKDEIGYIYGCSMGVVYRSIDGGFTWNIVTNDNLPYTTLEAIIVNETYDIFVAMHTQGVAVLRNGSNRWEIINDGLENLNCRSFTLDELGTLYVGTGQGIYKLGRDSTHWHKTINILQNKNVLNLHYTSNGVLLASANSIYRSDDYGESWSIVKQTSEVSAFTQDESNQILASTYGEILTSEDLGLQWFDIYNGLVSTDVRALVADSNNVFAGTYGNGIYKSNNAGYSWNKINDGLTSLYVNDFILNNMNLLAATNGGIFITSNAGANWIETGFLQSSMSISLTENNEIYTGTWNDGVYKSNMSNFNWVRVEEIPDNQIIWTVLSKDSCILVGGYGIYYSTNLGTTWASADSFDYEIYSLAATNTGSIIAGSDGKLYKSEDLGKSWRLVFDAAYDYFKDIIVVDNDIYAASRGQGIYVSSDDGENWEKSSEGLLSEDVISLCHGKNKIIFAGTYRYGVFSTNEISTVNYNQMQIPSNYLLNNYPNPFNPTTKIRYSILQSSNVVLKVYDILGREIATLVNEEKTEGEYEVEFNGITLPSGIYFYQLKVGTFVETKKMILLK